MEAQIKKPTAVYVQVQDRKNKRFESITVYGATVDEVAGKIRKQFAGEGAKHRTKRDRR